MFLDDAIAAQIKLDLFRVILTTQRDPSPSVAAFQANDVFREMYVEKTPAPKLKKARR